MIRLYVGSLVMFEAGSALCGGAPSMDALIVGRVWAGAGGAGMYLGALNILTINTGDNERPLYMSLTGFFWGSGCILGPVIGGAFADSSATWRWVSINAVACWRDNLTLHRLSTSILSCLPSLLRSSSSSLNPTFLSPTRHSSSV